MSKLLEAVKAKTKNMSCSVHNQKTEIKITGDKINFECCCDTFKSKIVDVSGKTYKEFSENELKNMFKKFK